MRPWTMVVIAVGAFGLSACDEHELKHAERLNDVTVVAISPSSVKVAKGAYRGPPDTPLTDATRAVLRDRVELQRDGATELGAGQPRAPTPGTLSALPAPTGKAITGREAHQNF